MLLGVKSIRRNEASRERRGELIHLPFLQPDDKGTVE